MLVEVCLSDLNSAINAVKGGATSIELCVDRGGAGGVTPSAGLISMVVQRVAALDSSVRVHVLVRPRGGDFVYSDDEFDMILQDIEVAKRAGAHGVVVGVLTAQRRIDMARMRLVRQACSPPMSLTFHRAFDVLDLSESSNNCLQEAGLEAALRQVMFLGCDRLLTSGRSEKAPSAEGVACLQRLTSMAAEITSENTIAAGAPQLVIVAAAGVSAHNCGSLVAATGVQGVHAGSSVTKEVFGAGSSSCSTCNSSGVKDFVLQQLVSEDLVRELVKNAVAQTPLTNTI